MNILQILSPPNRLPFQNGSGRLDLAAGISSDPDPLTARVIVNRVWLHHFDAGIVTTPDEFGNQSLPSRHPGLLDYLATNFITDGGSIKKLHRMINAFQHLLGLSFVLKSPEYESVPKTAVARPVNPARAKKLEGSFTGIPSDRQPLKPWEKYADAGLEANEAIFVN